jgi:hypothetical protein
MRPVLIDDLLALAGLLESVAPQARRAAVAGLCDEAHRADRLRKRLGRSVSAWGNGSVNAAVNAVTRDRRVRGISPASGGVGSLRHLLALSAAVDGILCWKQAQARRGGRRDSR